MKRFFLCLLAAATAATLTSCRPSCKQCHAEMMGVSGPSQKLCGDDLKKAEGTAGMVCE